MMEQEVTRPLSKLEQVDWASLEDAYGPATGMPERLRRWATGDKSADLFYSLWVWGEEIVYSAAAPAIPFMLGVLPDQPQMVMQAVAGLAHSRDATSEDEFASYNSEVQALCRQQKAWADATRQAVERGADLYRPYLKSSDPAIRKAAINVLALCVESRPEVLDWLLEALAQEKDPDLQTLYLETSYHQGFSTKLYDKLPLLNIEDNPNIQL